MHALKKSKHTQLCLLVRFIEKEAGTVNTDTHTHTEGSGSLRQHIALARQTDRHTPTTWVQAGAMWLEWEVHVCPERSGL